MLRIREGRGRVARLQGCAALQGDALPAVGCPQPRLSPLGAGGAGQGWPHPVHLLPNPAKRLGLQCLGNAISKVQSWWLWGIGVPSKGALLAPALPPWVLGSCSRSRLSLVLLWGWGGSDWQWWLCAARDLQPPALPCPVAPSQIT